MYASCPNGRGRDYNAGEQRPRSHWKFMQVPAFDPAVCAAPGPGPMAAGPGSANMPAPNPVDESVFTFRPVGSGESLGEQNAAGAEAPAPAQEPPTETVADSAISVSAGAAVSLTVAALLLL